MDKFQTLKFHLQVTNKTFGNGKKLAAELQGWQASESTFGFKQEEQFQMQFSLFSPFYLEYTYQEKVIALLLKRILLLLK